MIFSSVDFLFKFLPIFLVVYFVAREKQRIYVLLVGSLVFYALGEPILILLLLLSIVVNFFISKKIYLYRVAEKKSGVSRSRECKGLLALSIGFNLGLLFVFKYLGFFFSIINQIAGKNVMPEVRLTLPLGISFYTFCILSYVIDVYRKKYSVKGNIIRFATYVCLFPKLIQGPIASYDEVRHELKECRVKPKQIENGVTIFVIGMMYKVLLADHIASLWSEINTAGPYGINTITAWMGAWGFSFQIYFDFWGYSLMAIGLGKILGLKLPQNFNEPYSAKSATDFWRRWHITLGRWFREYLYIPLGGNRHGKVRLVINIFIVWLLTGLWHGANWNFIIWGMLFFVLLILEKFIYLDKLKKSKWAGHIYMMFVIPLSWTIFKITDIKLLGLYLRKMFLIPLPDAQSFPTMSKFLSLLGTYWWLLILCAFFSTPLPMKLIKKYKDNIVLKIILFAGFWLSVYEIIQGQGNPFLYLRF